MLSEEVIETIRATAADFLESCDVIDHHRGAPAPTGKKSLSYRLIYRAPDRILRESDVDALQDKIAEALQTELGARLLE
jgi:phenylalanyl-tRNA synthetase beta chain